MNEDAPYFSGTWEIDEIIQKRTSSLIFNINKLTSLLWIERPMHQKMHRENHAEVCTKLACYDPIFNHHLFIQQTYIQCLILNVMGEMPQGYKDE